MGNIELLLGDITRDYGVDAIVNAANSSLLGGGGGGGAQHPRGGPARKAKWQPLGGGGPTVRPPPPRPLLAVPVYLWGSAGHARPVRAWHS